MLSELTFFRSIPSSQGNSTLRYWQGQKNDYEKIKPEALEYNSPNEEKRARNV